MTQHERQGEVEVYQDFLVPQHAVTKKRWLEPLCWKTVFDAYALCVDLIGLYTLNGKDGSSIDPMCLTMIDPATS